jgi:biopolymer transport protein ExbD
MGQEKSKKSHTGRNVTITALLLAALLGGGHYGLGIGKGGGGEGLLPESGNSTQSETAQTQQAEESAAPQEAQEPESPAEEAPEADDGVLSIVVKEDKILYEGEETELAALEQALLRDYVQGKTTVTLTDDHAIKSAYDEVAALLDRLGIQAE